MSIRYTCWNSIDNLVSGGLCMSEGNLIFSIVMDVDAGNDAFLTDHHCTLVSCILELEELLQHAQFQKVKLCYFPFLKPNTVQFLLAFIFVENNNI